jgi:hypothetical protein
MKDKYLSVHEPPIHKLFSSDLGSDRDFHLRLRPKYSVATRASLQMSIGISIEDATIVRRLPQTVDTSAKMKNIQHNSSLPIINIASAKLEIS